MSLFIAIAAGAALIAMLAVAAPLLFRRSGAEARAAKDAAVFRDQLTELDRDLARGTISESEAEGARAEIARRLIGAQAKAEAGAGLRPAPQGVSGLVAGLSLLGVPVLAAAVYLANGSPGLRDLPHEDNRARAQAPQVPAAARLSQAEAEAAAQVNAAAPEGETAREDDPARQEYSDLIARLEKMVVDRPDDPEGRQLLANGYMRLGRYGEAWRAYAELIDLLGPEKAGASLYASQAEGMVLAANGYVSPEAEALVKLALSQNPNSEIGLYYRALGLAQQGELRRALPVWERLLQVSEPGAPWISIVRQMMHEAQTALGQGVVSPGATASGGGPSPEEIEAAAQLSPQERMEMVMAMVTGLEDRLMTQGGPPEKWVQLINSYMNLNRPGDAERAYRAALATLDGPAEAAVRQAVAHLGFDAGSGTTPAPGPTQEEVEAASQMAPQDRQAMIGGMVARLEERLTTEGGNGEEWFRLMNSYVQLGQMDDARRAYDLSQEALKGQDAGFLKEQALLMGVIVE